MKREVLEEEDDQPKNINIVSSRNANFHMQVAVFNFYNQVQIFFFRLISVSKVKITMNALTLLLMMGVYRP